MYKALSTNDTDGVTLEQNLEEACSTGPTSQKHYQTFEQDLEEEKPNQDPSHLGSNKHGRPFIAWCIVFTIIMSAAFMLATTNGFSVFNRSIPMLSNPIEDAPVRVCTFAECQRTMCDPITSPYVCTTGAAHDGCAATAAAWAHNPVCTDYCDVTHCAAALPSEKDPIRECGMCTPQQCLFYGAKCTAPSVFVCVEGSARYGCSPYPYEWPYALNGICTECCNKSSC